MSLKILVSKNKNQKKQFFIFQRQKVFIGTIIHLNFLLIIQIQKSYMQGDNPQYFSLQIDPQAYKFFPKRQEEKSAFEKKGTRFYFYGQIQHDEYQIRKLKEFHEYLAEKKKTYNKQLFNNDHLILQFLSSNKYKPKQTLKAMKEHQQFKIQYIPKINIEKIDKVLRSGFYYICGRDYHFRPILVYKVRMVDQKNYQPYFDASVIIQEKIIKDMFLPGQVESWNIIYDLESIPMSDLPLSSTKSIVEKISLNYGGRLHKFWALNASKGVSTVWKMVSTFLDDVTVQKVNISKTNSDKSIFEVAHPSQIEVKYGGTQPNRTQFQQPSDYYSPLKVPKAICNEKRLISNEQYENLLKSGKLTRNKIDPLYLSTK